MRAPCLSQSPPLTGVHAVRHLSFVTEGDQHDHPYHSRFNGVRALEHLNRTDEEGIAVLTPAGALVGIASLQAIQSELRAQSGQPI